MIQPAALNAPETPRWRWVAVSLLTIPVLLAVVFAVRRHSNAHRRELDAATDADAELNAASAEARRLDGPWRAEEIDSQREAVPDVENSANVLRLVANKAPLRWPEWEFTPPPIEIEAKLKPGAPPLKPIMPPTPILHQKTFPDLPPPVLLTPPQLEKVRGEMKRAAEAIALARTLADKPRGRIPFAWPKTLSALRYEQPDLGPAPTLLAYHAIAQAQEGNLELALQSCQALLNVGAAIGDTPSYPAQERRAGMQNAAVLNLERALALGSPKASALAAFQQRLESEAELRPMLIAARGERAATDRFCQQMQSGEVPVENFLRGTPMTQRELIHARALLLTRMTQRVEALKLPPEQLDRLLELPRSANSEPPLVHTLFSLKAAETYWPNTLAMLRCAAVGLAVERYRQQFGSWPAALTELTPEFIASVPNDPFDGAKLRYARREEGVCIYSIGRDKRDDGGDFATLRNPKMSDDAGFRLWHPDRRRQPPK